MKSAKTLAGKFHTVENHFRTGLQASKEQITHFGVQGADAENRWIDLLRYYLPKRYEVNRGFVVDSNGNTSDQIDCVVYDAFYTPSLYGENDGRYVPAEAVYAIFESKPAAAKSAFQYANNKVASVRKLHRTSASIVDRGESKKAREPFDIIGGLLTVSIGCKPDSAVRNFTNNKLDVVLCAGDKSENSFCADKFTKCQPIFYRHQEGALILGMFRLLAKLQSMGTVAPIQWDEYGKRIDN